MKKTSLYWRDRHDVITQPLHRNNVKGRRIATLTWRHNRTIETTYNEKEISVLAWRHNRSLETTFTKKRNSALVWRHNRTIETTYNEKEIYIDVTTQPYRWNNVQLRIEWRPVCVHAVWTRLVTRLSRFMVNLNLFLTLKFLHKLQ